MTKKVITVDDYLENISENRKEYFLKLRSIIVQNLPFGFKEVINYGMPSYVVPHRLYQPGYHCDPKLPLPFVSIASQKNFIAIYHMGIYANPNLISWFTEEYPKHCKRKIDMGKSCIRLKHLEDIPFDLIGELMTKMSVDDWISLYDKNIKK
ncbi:MAG: DUF1801 domain-containing protein [Crocinitomicaceae bacterium]|jgi:hypothetical protein|nr:DUF1801 domain-containing protein [Crocinitomicaceae bacterium]MBT6515204.1 DUF1801 domain-containing protein [Crocinitomicaceae bacterium]